MKFLTFFCIGTISCYCNAAAIDRSVATLHLPEDALSQKVTITKGLRNVTIKIIGHWAETTPISFRCLQFGTKVELELKNIYVYRHGLSEPTPEGLFKSSTCTLNVSGKLLLNENTLTIVP
ncbi:hypothetical protein [Pseudoalteromonas sp. MMG012]|uniref:hypothetical protein n=1 Tax=Pseudoalteromonas sp. MMG012 TaxID=2822686 RepID=UPI001B3A283D|nr:hypothetical protein [Pseudoalteromonas sp. MMG012]MBQ4852852.1 hypothetical protein [Pseudoalteromonas sp. MMG012]